MSSELNKAIGIVKDDLRNNLKFGSNFQFWVWQLTSEIEHCTNLTNEEAHNLAINCIKRIAQ